MNPKILLSDEATSALDPKNSEAIMELLNDINKSMGITIVLVTHQMNVVKSICDNMAIIEAGLIKDSGVVEEIFINQPKSLINILGDNKILLPNSGKNIEIMYKKDDSNNIIEKLIKKFNVNIINFVMEDYKNCIIGKVLININNKNDVKKVEEYLKSINIESYKILGE